LRQLVMLQATRADVAIKCTTPGVFTFQAFPQIENNEYFGDFTDEERVVQPIVFQLKIVPSSADDSFPTSQVQFPDYLQDLSQETPAREFTVSLDGATIAVKGEGLLITPSIGVNGVAFQGWEDPDWTEILCVNSLYQINIINAHPYHQHINHFQIFQTNAPSDGSILRVGEFRDTAFGTSFEAKENEIIRMKTWDYEGIYILHCHIVEHEDAGLMGGYEVKTCNHFVDTSDTIHFCELCNNTCSGFGRWKRACTNHIQGSVTFDQSTPENICCSFANGTHHKDFSFRNQHPCGNIDIYEPKLHRLCSQLGANVTCSSENGSGSLYECTWD